MPKVNCAVYTRKSNERGLDSEFSSLQNQEDACKAYILSQAFNGWEYYKTFEDGRISGGTMERPGLQALFEEIRAHRIQVVVVYKVEGDLEFRILQIWQLEKKARKGPFLGPL